MSCAVLQVEILETYKLISWNASLIVLAMLWSSFFNSAFAAIYYKAKGHIDEEPEECPERFGTYGCPYAGEEEVQPWAVVLPAFFSALLLVFVLLFGMAKCFGKYWVEFVTGICGHLIGFRWLEGIIWKMYGTLSFSDVFSQQGITSRPWAAYPEEQSNPSAPSNALDFVALWNSSSSGFTAMLQGESPQLNEMGGRFVGTLNATFKQTLQNFTEKHEIESHVGGFGENPETENPWCFFTDFRNRFVCYVGESFQVPTTEGHPLTAALTASASVLPSLTPIQHRNRSLSRNHCDWSHLSISLSCGALAEAGS